MKLLKTVALAGLLSLHLNAENMEEARLIYNDYSAQEIAKATSEELAKSAPMQVDEISYIASSNHLDSTVVVNTIVEEAALKGLAHIDTKGMTKGEKEEFSKGFINNLKQLQLNALCTTPMTRAALEKGVIYSYVYRWDNFTYLGEVNIDNKACENSKL